MKTLSPFLFIIFLIFNLYSSNAQNWTQFRGTNLDGKEPGQRPPLHWTPDSNIIWKTEIPGEGWSSPVVFNNQIWVSSALNDGKELFAVCIDKTNGKIIHNILLFKPDSVFGKHAVNSYATPTPCIEDGFVYANFGMYGTACVETGTAKIVWKRNDLICDHVQGPGASPILYKNMLILHFEGVDNIFIVALDKTTGKTIWKTERPAELYKPLLEIGRKAYITPIVLNVNGRDLLISNGSAVCIAYDILSGKEVWRIVQGEDSTIAMPVTENGVVYFYTSFISPPDGGEKYCELIAVDPFGEGDLTKTNILWHIKSPILQLSSPLINNGILYTIDSNSTLLCIDAKTGKSLYENKLKGKYNASPVLAGGYLYFSSTNGKTLVVKEGKVLNIVAENTLEGQIWASPAVVDNHLLTRTSKYLYLIGEK
jgi:outer membrane protein assembly factor BamB